MIIISIAFEFILQFLIHISIFSQFCRNIWQPKLDLKLSLLKIILFELFHKIVNIFNKVTLYLERLILLTNKMIWYDLIWDRFNWNFNCYNILADGAMTNFQCDVIDHQSETKIFIVLTKFSAITLIFYKNNFIRTRGSFLLKI